MAGNVLMRVGPRPLYSARTPNIKHMLMYINQTGLAGETCYHWTGQYHIIWYAAESLTNTHRAI